MVWVRLVGKEGLFFEEGEEAIPWRFFFLFFFVVSFYVEFTFLRFVVSLTKQSHPYL